jgi:hypothetical protein
MTRRRSQPLSSGSELPLLWDRAHHPPQHRRHSPPSPGVRHSGRRLVGNALPPRAGDDILSSKARRNRNRAYAMGLAALSRLALRGRPVGSHAPKEAGPLFWYDDETAERLGPGFSRGDPALGIHVPATDRLTPHRAFGASSQPSAVSCRGAGNLGCSRLSRRHSWAKPSACPRRLESRRRPERPPHNQRAASRIVAARRETKLQYYRPAATRSAASAQRSRTPSLASRCASSPAPHGCWTSSWRSIFQRIRISSRSNGGSN